MPSPRRIDFHFHLIPQFYQEAAYAAGAGPAIGRYPDWSPELALELMDQNGIAVALTSLAQPGVQFGDPTKAAALARRCNDYASELGVRWPNRFGAFAVVPMGDMRAATAETAVVFVHPALHPSSRKLDLPWPGFMMEYVFDTTRAAVNLVFSGAVERFPRIRFVLAHAGGLMPYFAWRLSISPMIDARLEQLSPADIYARLGRFWYDNALSPTAETLACVERLAPAGQIVFGSDWPFANARVISEAVKAYEAVPLSEARRGAIDCGNALSLFPQWA